MRLILIIALAILVNLGMGACGGKGEGPGGASGGSGDDCVSTDIDSALARSSVKLIDAHGHFMPGWTASMLLGELPKAGLEAMALLGPTDTVTTAAAAPDTFIGCYYFDVGEVTLDDVTSAIDGGAGCLGEVKVRHFASGPETADVIFDADDPILLSIYDEARDRGVPVNVHFDYDADAMETFESALESTRDDVVGDTKIIWAHSGDAPADAVMSLMDAHRNLYIDISSRNPLCTFTDRLLSMDEQRLDDGSFVLKSGWAEIFEKHKERVLFGTDIGPGDRHMFMAELVDYYRVLLAQVSEEAQAKIGHENAELLFGF